MELLQCAVTSNNFGLRKKFPWSVRHDGDVDPKIDGRNIRSNEIEFLAERLGSQISVTEGTFIGRIENPCLWSRYVLHYEEMKANLTASKVTEHIVVHATSISAAYEIADNNFDWRLVKRYRFGQGVSFAKDVDYAASQATRKGAYIIAGILVAASKIGNFGTQIPPGTFDTTTNKAKSVYVKYYDNDFYPYYIAY
ncbi:protein mono-ADP-ribosyltransferase PARP14 [Neodiprion lecontei]|uniref:Protein mono-ADP-ribosyltransferase PARP14 n=1 Tax=Neodiprion lecontei TaxID=441921 RepID=A0A6J0BQD4_NEOLC|nr:protein mono-ADP-ribosyltransferase PARP14 [Neodiprion lecontei]